MSLEMPVGTQWLGQLWRHAFVYTWLVFATVTASIDSDSTSEVVSSVLLVVLLGAWYGFWQIFKPGQPADSAAGPTVPSKRLYLLGAAGVWFLLVMLNPTFLIAGVSVFAPYCFDSARWALLSLVPCTGVWLWGEVAAGEGLDWIQVTVALLVVASGVAVAGYVGALSKQNFERQALIDQLRAAQSELAAAERRAGVLAERQRLARDIHDTLTQGFASIVMLLEAVDASLGSKHAARRHVAAAVRSARDNLNESRRLVWALRPDALADGQLPDALGGLVTRLSEETGLQAELVVTGAPHGLGRETETGLLRLAQEALANVRKHANARRVTVTISYMDDLAMLDIQDDGAGFEPAVVDRVGHLAGGLGLRAMRERAEELGGRLAVETAPGEGTTVVAEIPCGSLDTKLASAEGAS